MSTWRWFVVCGCTALLLSSCKPPLKEISNQVKKSIVLIYYQNKPGNGTGFFVQEKGNKPGCNVLTAGHVVPIQNQIKLQTSDDEIWEVSDILRFPNHDLAVINFKVDNKNECPYEALNIGNFDNQHELLDVYIGGFPDKSSEPKFFSGNVSHIGVDINGYGISYDANPDNGMSGSPVVNSWGKVIAVHKGKQKKLYRGIPIKTYLENFPQAAKNNQQDPQPKDSLEENRNLPPPNRDNQEVEKQNRDLPASKDDKPKVKNNGNSKKKSRPIFVW